MKKLDYIIQKLLGVFLVVMSALIAYVDKQPAYLIIIPFGLLLVLINKNVLNVFSKKEDED